MNKYKFAGIIGAVSAAVTFGMSAGATLINPPSYSDVVNSTTTAFGTSLFSDLLPWAGALLLITAAGLLLAAIVRRISGGFKRILGGGRRKFGRRRYR